MVICIGREFATGGHDVGFKLAEMLGIPYYDKKGPFNGPFNID